MPTKLQLVNRALSEIGRLAVTSINDSQDAQYLSAKIDELYQEVLLEANWNFAVIYRQDDTPLSTNYSPDYSYSYQIPGDFGKFFRFNFAGAQCARYEFVDGLLLCDTRPIRYYYISNQVPYENLPPLFARSLILYAASASSLTLTNNLQLTQYLKNEYQKSKIRAILENDMERSIVTMPHNDFDRINFV